MLASVWESELGSVSVSRWDSRWKVALQWGWTVTLWECLPQSARLIEMRARSVAVPTRPLRSGRSRSQSIRYLRRMGSRI